MTERAKVLFAINRLDVGGAERVMLDQLAAFNRERLRVHLLTLYDHKRENLLDYVPADVPHHPLRFSGPFDLGQWRELLAYLRRERFDVVVTSLFATNLIVRGAAILSGAPVIFSYEQNVYAHKERRKILADRLLARRTAKIIAVSEQVRSFTAKQERLPLSKFELIYNAAKLDFGDTRQQRESELVGLGLDPECVYVVNIGRLTRQKGQKYLIEAAARLRTSHPQARYLIFGEGELRDALAQQIESSGLTGIVRLMGVHEPHTIAAVADVFAFPSLWEGLSIALINMMDAGLPVVATSVSGTEEIVVDGENGLLVAPEDVDGLAEGVGRVLADRELAERLGRAAHQHARRFSIDRNVAALEELIMSELRAHRARHG